MLKCTISVITSAHEPRSKSTTDQHCEKRAVMKREYRFNIPFSRMNYIYQSIFVSFGSLFVFSVRLLLIFRFLEGNLLGVHFSSFSTDFSPIKGYSVVCGKVADRTIKVIPITHPAHYCFVNVYGVYELVTHLRRIYTHVNIHIYKRSTLTRMPLSFIGHQTNFSSGSYLGP